MQMRMMRNMELQKNKVLLGLSGGVDSATAALLLKEKGFNVTGFYFDVTPTSDSREKQGLPAMCSRVSWTTFPF